MFRSAHCTLSVLLPRPHGPQSTHSRPLVHLVLLFIFNPDCPQLPKISELTPNSFNPQFLAISESLTRRCANNGVSNHHRIAQNPNTFPKNPTQTSPMPTIHISEATPISLSKKGLFRTAIKASNPSAPTGSSPGLYSAQKFELTARNVDLVLEDVRPYLIADGGNVDVVSVEDGIVSLKLQGGLSLLLLLLLPLFVYLKFEINLIGLFVLKSKVLNGIALLILSIGVFLFCSREACSSNSFLFCFFKQLQ
jgi:hypothetical protein